MKKAVHELNISGENISDTKKKLYIFCNGFRTNIDK